jgi:4-amino-4-deoxy-L-arabinose transferase-like glycosyltransferase
LKQSNATLIHVVLMLALGAAVFLPGLGRETSVDMREAKHAEIAREMVLRGDYVVPYTLGRPYIDKPPLYNVTVALMFELTGRVDFLTARLPGALCSIAMILAVYALGRRWYNPRAGLWAAVIWSTSWLVVEWGRLARMDMMMAGLILFGILLADVAVTATRQRARALLWCGASILIAAAVLSKGAQALFFFVVPFVLMWRARRGRWVVPGEHWAALLVIVAALAVGWGLVAEHRQPGQIKALLGYQSGEGLVEHPARPWLYADQLLLRTAPWSLFCVGAIYWLIRRLRRSGLDLAVVPFLAFAVCVIVMTFIPNKREHYLLPILPLWSLFLAGFLDSAASERQAPSQEGGAASAIPRWAFELPLYVCLSMFALVAPAGAIWWLLSKHAGKAAGVATAIVVCAAAAAGICFALRRAKTRAVGMLMVAAIVLAVSAVPVVERFIPRPAPEIEMSAQIAAAIPPGASIAEYGIGDEYLFFKLNRDVTFIHEKEELAEHLKKPGSLYLIVAKARLAEVQKMLSRPPTAVNNWQAGSDEKDAVSMLVISP